MDTREIGGAIIELALLRSLIEVHNSSTFLLSRPFLIEYLCLTSSDERTTALKWFREQLSS